MTKAPLLKLLLAVLALTSVGSATHAVPLSADPMGSSVTQETLSWLDSQEQILLADDDWDDDDRWDDDDDDDDWDDDDRWDDDDDDDDDDWDD